MTRSPRTSRTSGIKIYVLVNHVIINTTIDKIHVYREKRDLSNVRPYQHRYFKFGNISEIRLLLFWTSSGITNKSKVTSVVSFITSISTHIKIYIEYKDQIKCLQLSIIDLLYTLS